MICSIGIFSASSLKDFTKQLFVSFYSLKGNEYLLVIITNRIFLRLLYKWNHLTNVVILFSCILHKHLNLDMTIFVSHRKYVIHAVTRFYVSSRPL